ncbi:hypothetical protein [Bordetella avium]|uniref:Uncharacterized protein n=1 Tax=Bordetella avium (strain 197N) TaxID=360910 RepID=Q2KVU9_BORA1|nr:hypothetical protein [Bordetella avium]RIQ11849.1 hypothetical protein D0432_15545 [Bordetella avium]RIQ37486.1 hypothetical protein D0848_10870 [Bordetella avium]RIQ38984.1 hypothetical protein D0847_15875 [Bordetella avium]RIQ40328.1 hypothetical protein D0846_15895 [Bordetella avium]RIQ46385.1 hypothetical protein D0845_16345 [Bordetella avium]
MPASTTAPAALSRFSETELDMLAKTADALSAYLGQPVLAEVAQSEEGMEWVAFGVALDDDAEEGDKRPHVQMGGQGARILGGRGGLPDTASQAYDCLYLWAIQLSLVEGERFIKLDQDGEECAWSDTLSDVLPFDLNETADDISDDDDEEDEDHHDHHHHRH